MRLRGRRECITVPTSTLPFSDETHYGLLCLLHRSCWESQPSLELSPLLDSPSSSSAHDLPYLTTIHSQMFGLLHSSCGFSEQSLHLLDWYHEEVELDLWAASASLHSIQTSAEAAITQKSKIVREESTSADATAWCIGFRVYVTFSRKGIPHVSEDYRLY